MEYSLPGNSLELDVQGRPSLMGCLCNSCGNLMFPRVLVCNQCMGEGLSPKSLATSGTLYAFTLMHTGPAGWDKPYLLGYVDLADGVRVFSHLRGEVAIGQSVELGIKTVGHRADGSPITTYMFQKTSQ